MPKTVRARFKVASKTQAVVDRMRLRRTRDERVPSQAFLALS
jgi:hypothetical protein